MTTAPEPVEPGCPWPVDEGCLTGWDDLDDDLKDRSVALASETLRRLTGYRVGGCPVTVRPCKKGCVDLLVTPSYYDMLSYGGGVSFWPHINADGLWVNSCGCQTDCGCSALCEIRLPAPVGRVDAVKIDGDTLDADQYRVDGDRLVYLGGGDCVFPACQDMELADSEPGTFSVTYLNAFPVDTIGAYAAGILANEFAKACTTGKCRLPSTVTSIARQGVSMDVVTGSFPNGFTGIREVDAFIGLWNPDALRQSPQVWSPDLRSPRVVR
jgi:hypothetical protein